MPVPAALANQAIGHFRPSASCLRACIGSSRRASSCGLMAAP